MLSSKDLLDIGLKPDKTFGFVLNECKKFSTKEEAIKFAKSFLVEKSDKVKKTIPENSVLHLFLNDFRPLIPYFLEGRKQEPSNSEILRLFENRAVLINGITPPADGCIDNQFPLWELVFFPNSNRRTTIIKKDFMDKQFWFNCRGDLLDLKGNVHTCLENLPWFNEIVNIQ